MILYYGFWMIVACGNNAPIFLSPVNMLIGEYLDKNIEIMDVVDYVINGGFDVWFILKTEVWQVGGYAPEIVGYKNFGACAAAIKKDHYV